MVLNAVEELEADVFGLGLHALSRAAKDIWMIVHDLNVSKGGCCHCDNRDWTIR